MNGHPLITADHSDSSAGDDGGGAHLGERRRGFAGDPCPHCEGDEAHALPACPGPWPGDCDGCHLAALPPLALRPLREELFEQLVARSARLMRGFTWTDIKPEWVPTNRLDGGPFWDTRPPR